MFVSPYQFVGFCSNGTFPSCVTKSFDSELPRSYPLSCRYEDHILCPDADERKICRSQHELRRASPFYPSLCNLGTFQGVPVLAPVPCCFHPRLLSVSDFFLRPPFCCVRSSEEHPPLQSIARMPTLSTGCLGKGHLFCQLFPGSVSKLPEAAFSPRSVFAG